MRLHGLLCWFDEPIDNLVKCLAMLKASGVDHVVAVDGRYAIYPDGEAASHPDQRAAIEETCRQLGMACTVHVPSSPWPQNEPQKRTALFALAWALADEGDWFWVQDADQFVLDCPEDLKDRLASSEFPVAEITMVDRVAERVGHKSLPPTFELRCMFRAQPITVGPAHCDYIGADGHGLWHGHGIGTPVPALDLTDVVTVEHCPDQRPAGRLRAKLAYYAARDESGVERGACFKCGEPAVRLAATKWRMSEIGPVGEWREVCKEHAEWLRRVGRRQLRGLGVDPDSVEIAARNGRIPAPAA